jgi:trigger factor
MTRRYVAVEELSVQVEDLSQVKKKMSFEVPWPFVKDELDSVYRDIGKKAKIKGFRQGKIPRKMLESYFKADAESEAITNIVNKYYWQELDNRGIVTLSRPEIEQDGLKENASFSFSASFETEPSFEPQGYTDIELEKINISISEKDMQTRLTEIRKMFATMQDVTEERPARTGDFVMIDFQGTLDGEAPPEMKGTDYMLELGSKRFIPGFEEEVEGMTVNQTKEVRLTFPADYHEKKIAGKEVFFTVTLKGLKEQTLPELDEDFIKNFDKYNSLEDLKNDVRQTMEEQSKRQSDAKLQEKIMDVILSANEFEAPATLVERQIFYMMADTQKRMRGAGMDEKSAMDFSFKMHDQFKPEALKTVRAFLLIKKIAEKEGITVTDEEIDDQIKAIAANYQTDYEVVRQAYEDEERMGFLKTELMEKKVFDFIQSRANIKIVEQEGLIQEGQQ